MVRALVATLILSLLGLRAWRRGYRPFAGTVYAFDELRYPGSRWLMLLAGEFAIAGVGYTRPVPGGYGRELAFILLNTEFGVWQDPDQCRREPDRKRR